MPITRSDMRVFTTCVAAGALAGTAVSAANAEFAKATDVETGVGRAGESPGMVRPEDEAGRAVPSSACSRQGQPRAPLPCDSSTGKDPTSGPMTSRTAGKDST